MLCNQYFIDIINILQKLPNALATSKFTLIWKAQLLGIMMWLLSVVFFQVRKEKKKLKFQTIILKLLNYIFICHFRKCCSSKFDPFFIGTPTTKPLTFWKIHFGHLWHHFKFVFCSTTQGQDHVASWQQTFQCWNL